MYISIYVCVYVYVCIYTDGGAIEWDKVPAVPPATSIKLSTLVSTMMISPVD